MIKGKKISKVKVIKPKSKSSKIKVKNKKNPNLRMRSYKLRDKEYILLSDFEDQLTRSYKNLTDEDYHDWDYEIDNILKYELGFNSNSVGGEHINLLSLHYFEYVVKKGLTSNFDDPNIIKAFNNTLKSILKEIEYIDLGN